MSQTRFVHVNLLLVLLQFKRLGRSRRQARQDFLLFTLLLGLPWKVIRKNPTQARHPTRVRTSYMQKNPNLQSELNAFERKALDDSLHETYTQYDFQKS